MPTRFLAFTTFLFTFITLTEAFQITKLFTAPRKQFDMATEQTFIAVKPDGVMRGLVGEIISRFEKRGYFICPDSFCLVHASKSSYKLVALKMVHASKEHLEKHCPSSRLT